MARKSLKFELNPLFSGPTLESRVRQGNPYRELPLVDLDVDPDQPRRVFNSDALSELAESIRSYGVLSPVLVRPGEGGTYTIVAGERRFRAAKLAGLETIPAIVDQSGDGAGSGELLAKQLVENIQREDLTPMERALAIGQLRDQFKLSVRDIAAKLGISKSGVQRSLDILALPDDLQAALISGLPESKVVMLATVKDSELRRELLEKIEALSRNELEFELEDFLAESQGFDLSHGGTVGANRQGDQRGRKRAKSKSDLRKRKLTVEDRRIVEEIQRSLGTKVELIRKSGKNNARGRLTVEFYSASDLYEVYRRLTS